MEKQIRTLTGSGQVAFSGYLAGLRETPQMEPPLYLLNHPSHSHPLNKGAVVEDQEFENKLAAGRYLSDAVGTLSPEVVDGSVGLWSWLALFYFHRLCPADSQGRRRPVANSHYILDTSFRLRYRHLLETPYRLYREHKGEAGRGLLSAVVNVHGDAMEQVASRQELWSNPTFLEAFDFLYYDPDMDRIRPGTVDRDRAGSLRRLIAVYQQLDLNFDLYGISSRRLVELLPSEFEQET